MLLGRAGKGPALLSAFPVIGVSLFVSPPLLNRIGYFIDIIPYFRANIF